jgi:acetylornithine deacetylase
MMFQRPPYEIDSSDPLPALLVGAANSAGVQSSTIGMSFWTDAAILGGAGIPSVLFGPTGAGLHSLEEWVEIDSVLKCRDSLVTLCRRFTSL